MERCCGWLRGQEGQDATGGGGALLNVGRKRSCVDFSGKGAGFRWHFCSGSGGVLHGARGRPVAIDAKFCSRWALMKLVTWGALQKAPQSAAKCSTVGALGTCWRYAVVNERAHGRSPGSRYYTRVLFGMQTKSLRSPCRWFVAIRCAAHQCAGWKRGGVGPVGSLDRDAIQLRDRFIAREAVDRAVGVEDRA